MAREEHSEWHKNDALASTAWAAVTQRINCLVLQQYKQLHFKGSVWIRVDNAYLVGETYTLLNRSVWFFAGVDRQSTFKVLKAYSFTEKASQIETTTGDVWWYKFESCNHYKYFGIPLPLHYLMKFLSGPKG